MPRAKLPRKSTTVDMTAMCDVAFLLLSFFILATKFKPPEALSVTTPSSVYNRIAPESDVFMVIMDKDGKVYFSVSDKNVTEKQEMIDQINTEKNLNLTTAEKNTFVKNPSSFIGVPFSQLKSFLDKAPEDLKNVVLPGIPTQDSTNNELRDWVASAVQISADGGFGGGHLHVLVKGDDAAKYPTFSGVIWALKKNDQLKFQLITSPIAPPLGSELEKELKTSGSKSVE